MRNGYPSSYCLYVYVVVVVVVCFGTAGLGVVPAVVDHNASSVDADCVVVGWVVDVCWGAIIADTHIFLDRIIWSVNDDDTHYKIAIMMMKINDNNDQNEYNLTNIPIIHDNNDHNDYNDYNLIQLF